MGAPQLPVDQSRPVMAPGDFDDIFEARSL
jgi:hypothetical protein